MGAPGLRMLYFSTLVIAVLFACPSTPAQTQLFSATPIMDMPQPDGSCLTYNSFPGGLYENCSNTVPADHDADGLNIVTQIQPLDVNGNPSPTGKVIFISMGMSNAQNEFAGFLTNASKNKAVNHTTLSLSNGAASNMDACFWFPATGGPSCLPSSPNNYDRIARTLPTRGLSMNQVQVAWLKEANGRVHTYERGCQPEGTLCVPLCDPTVTGCVNSVSNTDAVNLEWELGNDVRAAKQRWPNLKMVFLTSRIYAGYALPSAGSPEPYAYETGFAVQWLIEAQIVQMRTGVIDPIAGDLNYNDGTAPWLAWGPYFWADGPNPRSDGLVWCDGALSPNPPCNGEVDFEADGQHPTSVNKQVNMMLNFFLNSPYTKPWFSATP
ncbi:MAG TPA: hypothetical protein VJR23_06010 [Candidatus Acidoferrales bacterium]|nr:hypothetical protein [Candidatus Acidoferrales bacterium]